MTDAQKSVVGGIVAGIVTAVAVLVIGAPACTGTPDERLVKAAKAESDLCKLRAFARAAEAAIPGGAPEEGTIRHQIESAEDALCAARAAMVDAGITAPAATPVLPAQGGAPAVLPALRAGSGGEGGAPSRRSPLT